MRQSWSVHTTRFRVHRGRSPRSFAAHKPLHHHRRPFRVHARTALFRRMHKAYRGPSPVKAKPGKSRRFPGAGAAKAYTWRTPKPAPAKVRVPAEKWAKAQTPAQVLAAARTAGAKKTGQTRGWRPAKR